MKKGFAPILIIAFLVFVLVIGLIAWKGQNPPKPLAGVPEETISGSDEAYLENASSTPYTTTYNAPAEPKTLKDTSATFSTTTFNSAYVYEYSSPSGKYSMLIDQEGDGLITKLKNIASNKIILIYDIPLKTLPGYNDAWKCYCTGPYFYKWLSDDLFIAKFNVNAKESTEENAKFLTYQMTVETSSGKVDLSTFKLVSNE